MNEEFNLCQSPVLGRYLIEASAGTGKTYSLEHLVLRFLVELSVPIDRILIVTFTNAATAEIYERVRTALCRLEKAVTEQIPLEDGTEEKLLEKWKTENRDVGGLIRRALDSFDDAAVQTIHGFCQKMLTEFNFTRAGNYDIAYGQDPGFEPKVVAEFLRRKLAEVDETTAQELCNWTGLVDVLKRVSVSRDVLKGIESRLEPPPAPEDTKKRKSKKEETIKEKLLPEVETKLEEIFREFVETAPDRLETLEKQAGITGFTSLLTGLYRLVNDTPRGRASAALIERIRQRFDVVLVDEFQDTDSLQYGIFKTLFLPEDETKGPRAVFFVGDPKQAIYGFRMAELETYLKARRELAQKHPENILCLKKNFRSTPTLVEAVNVFFGSPYSFLNPELQMTEVEAEGAALPLVRDNGRELEALPAFNVWLTPEGDKRNTDDIRLMQAQRVAEDIARLLSDGKTKLVRHGNPRVLTPGDIVILVRKRTNTAVLVQELARRGIRSVVRGAGDVFATVESREILAILGAMNDPLNRVLFNTARATRLWGRTAAELKSADESIAVSDRELIETCAQICRNLGPAAAFMYLQTQAGTVARLLPVKQGQGVLENYSHIIELLQGQFARVKTPGALYRWYARELASPSTETSDQRKIRTPSDDSVVRIDTIHSSKGLEYPVVYLIWGTDLKLGSKDKSVYFNEITHDEQGNESKSAVVYPQVVSLTENEKQRQMEELVRLAYVAMTRASSRLVLSLETANNNSIKTSLKNAYVYALLEPVVFDQKGSEILLKLVGKLKELQKNINEKAQKYPAIDAKIFGENRVWSKNPNEDVCVIAKDVSTDVTTLKASVNETLPELKPAHAVYADWQRNSFTSIARTLPMKGGADAEYEAEEMVVETDESAMSDAMHAKSLPEVEPLQAQDESSKLAFFRGADVGDWLHKLFEAYYNACDMQMKDSVKARVRHSLETASFMQGKTTEEVDEIAQLVVNMIENVDNVSLLPAIFETSEFCLKDLPADSHVNEMPFLLPVKKKHLDSKRMLKVLADAGMKFDTQTELQLTGYLTGAIDMVMFAQGKYWVIDWKSNFIGDGTPKSYTQKAMAEEIEKKHYRLQYLIYLLALKRHLIASGHMTEENVWEHIGGALYVFLRGVDCRANADADGGVLGIHFDCPRRAVDALDALLEEE